MVKKSNQSERMKEIVRSNPTDQKTLMDLLQSVNDEIRVEISRLCDSSATSELFPKSSFMTPVHVDDIINALVSLRTLQNANSIITRHTDET